MSTQSRLPGFDDGKAPDALRTIGEVATALNIRQHVLRYWEDQFPMLKPIKRSGGRRYYRPEDIQLVSTINMLVHQRGYTLRGARLAIEGGEGKPAPGSQAPDFQGPDLQASQSQRSEAVSADVIAKLRAIRASLSEALAAAG